MLKNIQGQKKDHEEDGKNILRSVKVQSLTISDTKLLIIRIIRYLLRSRQTDRQAEEPTTRWQNQF
jgi:hypothetical protein